MHYCGPPSSIQEDISKPPKNCTVHQGLKHLVLVSNQNLSETIANLTVVNSLLCSLVKKMLTLGENFIILSLKQKQRTTLYYSASYAIQLLFWP